ncbi:MAG: RelA/SpoT domain-containing protein [Methanocellales archaeon]|nr:RelA/SpoT domain-containing protein [Methanocellales archaeon]MDD3291275.1 RelA/SpoT domain-containing protein [Methanocellales archaeon]MDD5235447.1 RelA/SpoT domain-containing protein [Methanocellales archaeon]MDD5484470.1 RelA/SpoT domain-containing protein [Methanocellales archaeon]
MDSKTKEKINKFVENYEKSRTKYTDFAKSVSAILEQILKSKHFKYQQIQSRSKDIDSLRKKLENNPNLINNIHDLAGCRVIFYLEEDIYKFSEFIKQELKIEDIKDKRSPDNYNALHIIVKLDNAREKLVEYTNFKDLICEIQLTTPLFHAWSEINRDIIYKPDQELMNFSPKDFDFLKEKLAQVMSKYITKASYNFSFIVDQFERLKEGKQILNIDKLKELSQLGSNEKILEYMDKLNIFSSYYRLPEEFDFLPILEDIWNKSKQNDGNSKTKKSQDIITASFRFIRSVKYWDYKRIIELCVNKCSEDLFRKECLETLKVFGKYDLNAVRAIGYTPQKILIERISQLDSENTEIKDALISICGSLLNNTIEGSAQEQFDTFTLIMGPIPIKDKIKEIRHDSIQLLIKLFENEQDCRESEKIITALFNSSSPIHNGKTTEEHTKTMRENIDTILSFLIQNYDKIKNYNKRAIEKHLIWFSGTGNESEKLKEIKGKLSGDENYLKYKTFVGYGLDYGSDFEQIEKERKEQIESYVIQITDKNLNEWKNYLVTEILADYNDQNQGEYQNVHYFLYKLAVKKPNEGRKLLDISELSKFRVALLIGLLGSDKKSQIKKDIKTMIKKSESLSEIASAFFSVKDIDECLLSDLTNKILKNGEISSILAILHTICGQYSNNKNLKALFVKIIDKMTDLSFYEWPQKVSYLTDEISKDLSVDEYEIILKNLVMKKVVDYYTEQVLLPLAEKEPERIIDFFYKRVKNKESGVKLIDSIPFDFQLLTGKLNKNSDLIIKEIFKWFENGDGKLRWGASCLFNIIFPKIEGDIKGKLIQIIKTKDTTKLDYILWILDKYEGSPDVLEIIKEIVKNFEVSHELRLELQSILSHIRFVGGEYGLVKAYEEKIKDITSWKDDPNESVSSFAKSYMAYLQNRIKCENARVEREIDLRRSEFDRFKTIEP